MKQPVDVHIRRIVLQGMPPGGERRLRDAIQRQIAQQLQRTGQGRVPPAEPRSEDHVARTVAATVRQHAEARPGFTA